MKIKELYIENIRGIKYLSIFPNCENFVVYGLNGTGKSAVVDAIDLLLTGNISRISGEGTGNIFLKKHGKHVDEEDEKNAFVKAIVIIDNCDTEIEISRCMEKNNELVYDEKYKSLIEPILILAENKHHILSRKEILNLIVSAPKSRAEKITNLKILKILEGNY